MMTDDFIQLCQIAKLNKEQALLAMEYLLMLRARNQRKQLTALIEKEFKDK